MTIRDLAFDLQCPAIYALPMTLTDPRQSGKTALCRAVITKHPNRSVEVSDEDTFAQKPLAPATTRSRRSGTMACGSLQVERVDSLDREKWGRPLFPGHFETHRRVWHRSMRGCGSLGRQIAATIRGLRRSRASVPGRTVRPSRYSAPSRSDRIVPLLLGKAKRGRIERVAFGGESNILGPHRLVALFAEVSFAVDLPGARAVDGVAVDLEPGADLPQYLGFFLWNRSIGPGADIEQEAAVLRGRCRRTQSGSTPRPCSGDWSRSPRT